MTDFEPLKPENNPTSNQALNNAGIPELGSNFERKLNWKGVAFIAVAFIVAGISLFWLTGGFSGKKPSAKDKQDEIVTIPEAPKKALPVSGTVANPNTGAPSTDTNLKVPDDSSLAIELRRKRTGVSLDANGQPVATNQATGAASTLAAAPDTDPTKIFYKQYGSNKTLSKFGLDVNDPVQSIIKRRAVDSGGVAIYLGGTFLPKGGPATIQYSNMEGPRTGVDNDLGKAVDSGQKDLQALTSVRAASAPTKSNTLDSLSSASSSPSANEIAASLLETNKREIEQINSDDSESTSRQLPLARQSSKANTIIDRSGDRKAINYPASLARNIPANPSLYLPQGTSIRCILQTLILSDLEGPTICNITEDVRSFDSTNVLIPKGSRVMGDYKSQQALSLDRVAIVWNRLITPDNIDIAINSPGTSPLGSMGVQAVVDNRIADRILPALFISLASDAFKIALIKNGPTVKKSYIDPTSGRVVISEEPFDSITVKNTEKLAEQQLASKLAVPARLSILQGTVINILTAQDLDFSTVYAAR
jgi:type IV secretory pathway VirB10-like protein